MHLGKYLIHLYFMHFTKVTRFLIYVKAYPAFCDMVTTCESQILAITKFFRQQQYQMQLLVPFNSFHASFYLQKTLSLRDIWGLHSSHFWYVILCSLVGSTNISEESAVTTANSRGTQVFQKVQEPLESSIQNLDTWVT